MTNKYLVTSTVAGVLLLFMIVFTIANGLVPVLPRWLAAIPAWIAGALLFPSLALGQRIQVSLIGAIGLTLMIVAWHHGVSFDAKSAMQSNIALITMIAAVGFLRLVAMRLAATSANAPVGPVAYVRTLVAVAVLGSVINISAPILVADRLSDRARLSRLASQSITRVFSGCSAWSPFFGGMATVITYVDDAQLLWLMLAGLPFALVGLLVVITEAKWHYNAQLASFEGYPMTVSSLKIPALLAITVLCFFQLLPNTSILVVIATASLSVTTVALLFQSNVRSTVTQMYSHVRVTLSRMGGELLLFLSAGVLATGLTAIVDLGWISLSFAQFNATTASVILGGMLVLSAIGIHPVILVASFTPILQHLSPNPNVLALTYLLAWSIGTCASPLSGPPLMFQGRYGISSWKAATWNWPFALVMYTIGATLLYLMAGVSYD